MIILIYIPRVIHEHVREYDVKKSCKHSMLQADKLQKSTNNLRAIKWHVEKLAYLI